MSHNSQRFIFGAMVHEDSILVSHKVCEFIMFEFGVGFFEIESENICLDNAGVYFNHWEFFKFLGEPLSIFMIEI